MTSKALMGTLLHYFFRVISSNLTQYQPLKLPHCFWNTPGSSHPGDFAGQLHSAWSIQLVNRSLASSHCPGGHFLERPTLDYTLRTPHLPYPLLLLFHCTQPRAYAIPFPYLLLCVYFHSLPSVRSTEARAFICVVH